MPERYRFSEALQQRLANTPVSRVELFESLQSLDFQASFVLKRKATHRTSLHREKFASMLEGLLRLKMVSDETEIVSQDELITLCGPSIEAHFPGDERDTPLAVLIDAFRKCKSDRFVSELPRDEFRLQANIERSGLEFMQAEIDDGLGPEKANDESHEEAEAGANDEVQSWVMANASYDDETEEARTSDVPEYDPIFVLLIAQRAYILLQELFEEHKTTMPQS